MYGDNLTGANLTDALSLSSASLQNVTWSDTTLSRWHPQQQRRRYVCQQPDVVAAELPCDARCRRHRPGHLACEHEVLRPCWCAPHHTVSGTFCRQKPGLIPVVSGIDTEKGPFGYDDRPLLKVSERRSDWNLHPFRPTDSARLVSEVVGAGGGLMTEDWFVNSVQRVCESGRNACESVDAAISPLLEASEARLAGRPISEIVDRLIGSGGRDIRLGAAEAFRQFEREIQSMRVGVIRAMVDDERLTITDASGPGWAYSRQAGARLYRSAVGHAASPFPKNRGKCPLRYPPGALLLSWSDVENCLHPHRVLRMRPTNHLVELTWELSGSWTRCLTWCGPHPRTER